MSSKADALTSQVQPRIKSNNYKQSRLRHVRTNWTTARLTLLEEEGELSHQKQPAASGLHIGIKSTEQTRRGCWGSRSRWVRSPHSSMPLRSAPVCPFDSVLALCAEMNPVRRSVRSHPHRPTDWRRAARLRLCAAHSPETHRLHFLHSSVSMTFTVFALSFLLMKAQITATVGNKYQTNVNAWKWY